MRNILSKFISKKPRTRSGRTTLGLNALETRCVMSTAALANGALLINGTKSDDAINVRIDTTGQFAIVEDAGVAVAKFDRGEFKRIEIRGYAGNDKIEISDLLKKPVLINGGEGDDSLVTRGDQAILVGGGGNDQLVGGARNDILIGGNGSDLLMGMGGDDILIGGQAKVESKSDAMFSMLDVWNSGAAYAKRVSALRHGSVSFPALDLSTVGSDGKVDSLFGGSGEDWFLATSSDKLHDWKPGEEFK